MTASTLTRLGDPWVRAAGLPNELLLVGLLQAWADNEHPGDQAFAANVMAAGLLAQAGGASLSEAVRAGRDFAVGAELPA